MSKFILEIDIRSSGMQHIGNIHAFAKSVLKQVFDDLPYEADFNRLLALKSEQPFVVLCEACDIGPNGRPEDVVLTEAEAPPVCVRILITPQAFDKQMYSLIEAEDPKTSLSTGILHTPMR